MNRPTDEQEQKEHYPQRVHDEDRKASRRGDRDRGVREPRRIEISKLRDAGHNLGVQLEEQTRKRPYVVVGAAVGLGFVAGSLFGSRLGQVVLAAGIGYAAKNLFGGDLGVDSLDEGLGKLAQERPKG